MSQVLYSKVQGSIQPTNKLLVFDFFAGTGSSTKAFEDAGHTVIKVGHQDQCASHEPFAMNHHQLVRTQVVLVN